MDLSTLTWEVEDSVARVTLNRPDELNSFTVQMADDLESTFEELGRDDRVGAIVVTGAGKAFCAGMDLRVAGNVFGLDEEQRPTLADMRDRLADEDIARGVRDTGGRVSLAIYQCPKPVIGAINGAAVGVGATMTLPMDFRFASTRARVGFVFGRLGIVPEACSTWFLPRLVGLENALELAYSARILDAEEALALGLVRETCAPEDLIDRATAFGRGLVEGRSPVAVALTRQMMYRNSAEPSPWEAHRVESLAMFYTSIADGKEGVAAFREKRDPQYAGRVPADLPPFVPWRED